MHPTRSSLSSSRDARGRAVRPRTPEDTHARSELVVGAVLRVLLSQLNLEHPRDGLQLRTFRIWVVLLQPRTAHTTSGAHARRPAREYAVPSGDGK
jgi:hypothetical protein